MTLDTTADTPPPPLPAETLETPGRFFSKRTAHLRSWPWLLLAAAGAAAATDAALWAGDSLQYGLGGYGVAVATVCAAGALIALRRDLELKNPLWVMLAATTAAGAWMGSGLSVLLAPLLLLALVRRSGGDEKSSGAPWFLAGPGLWFVAFLESLGLLFSKIFRGRTSAWVASVAAGGFFLIILGLGNAALGKYVGEVTRELARFLALRPEDLGHILFWFGGIFAFGLLASPRPKRRDEGVFVDTPAKAAPVAVAVMIGANLAFLASNLTDTYWLGWMRSSPDGVSTTDYLYHGAYALMADAAIAAALLLWLFRADGIARGDRRARFLGFALTAQCVWLGFGVAGRLALQMEKYGFTPVRLWGVILLLWGFVGLWGVARHLRKTPSFRAFVRLAAWSAMGGLCVLQFRPPAVLSVDLNLACFRSHPEWKFDLAYFTKTGIEGWRLSRDIERESSATHGETESADAIKRFWETEFGWQNGGPGGFDRPPVGLLDWRVRCLRTDALCAEWKATQP